MTACALFHALWLQSLTGAAHDAVRVRLARAAMWDLASPDALRLQAPADPAQVDIGVGLVVLLDERLRAEVDA